MALGPRAPASLRQRLLLAARSRGQFSVSTRLHPIHPLEAVGGFPVLVRDSLEVSGLDSAGAATIAPVLLQGARLVLKDDSTVKLGYVSEANSDPCFPYPEIAQQIAERAGLKVEHRGNFRRSVQKKYFGLSRAFLNEEEGTVDESDIELLNKSHQRWVMRILSLLIGLVVLGITLDIIFPPSSGTLATLLLYSNPGSHPRRLDLSHYRSSWTRPLVHLPLAIRHGARDLGSHDYFFPLGGWCRPPAFAWESRPRCCQPSDTQRRAGARDRGRRTRRTLEPVG